MRIYRYYTIAIIALGAGCVWLASISYDRQPGTIYFAWQHLTLFILLGLLLNRMTSRLLGPGRRYAMAFFAPIVLLGPAMTTLLGTAASLLQGAASILREACFDRRKTGDEGTSAPSRRKGDESIYQGKGRNGLFATHLLNAAQAAIAIMFSGQIFLALGAEVGEIHTAPDLVPAVLAGVCLLLIEILLSETTTAFDRGRPLLPAWRNGLARSLPVEGSVVGLGLLLALLYQQPHLLLPEGGANRPLGIIFITLVVIVPCWLLYYSYQLFLEMRQAYERTLRTLSGLVEVRLWGSSQVSAAKQEGLSTPGARSRQTAQLAAAIAEQMGVSPAEMEHVRFAGYLLEVGKIGLHRDLLARRSGMSGSLSPRQRKAFARHAELASQILEPVEFLRSVALLVRHQQERYDGLGYPSGMKGEWIPLGARILAVAQAYTELTEGNEASSPLSAQEALARICASRGVRYDPKVIDVLTEILRTRGLIPMSAECRVAPAEV